jgi:hypothetical protein
VLPTDRRLDQFEIERNDDRIERREQQGGTEGPPETLYRTIEIAEAADVELNEPAEAAQDIDELDDRRHQRAAPSAK